MKQKIILSPVSILLTLFTILLLIALAAYKFKSGDTAVAWTVIAILACIIIPALFFSPVSSAADEAGVYVRHPLRTSFYPVEMISSVELFSPSMNEKCVIGSRGCFGYWGFFYDGGIKKYVACYGKASQCVLLTLKNGRKYVIGAADNIVFADYICKILQKNGRHLNNIN